MYYVHGCFDIERLNNHFHFIILLHRYNFRQTRYINAKYYKNY